VCPPPFCLSVKLNSGDYMAEGGLTTDEALEQVRWLLEWGMVDFVEISGGIGEQSTSKLHSESEGIVGAESLGTDFGCRFI
jgi:2,4-dienoyl-CoA reductase-like NADH-dependent reductase (Old Yellow Enzyme family)